MKRSKKHVAVLALALCATLSLSACGSSGVESATTLVQGNIDVIYLNKYNSEYLEMVDSTEAEAQQDYLDGLETEAEYFAHYWGIVDASYGESYEDLDEGLRNDIVELYDEIYSHSKYEIQEAVEQDGGGYTVKVLVDPIDIMQQASDLYNNDGYEPLNEFWVKYAETDFSTMSDEDYMAYTNEYGQIIVRLVRDQLPNLGYMEQKSQVIQIEETDGVLSMNEDDWGIFDTYIIYYP